MTTTLRKAITGVILLVFLQVGDALKGNGLRRRRDVVAATNFAANEPRALVDILAERKLHSTSQDVSKKRKGSSGETNDGFNPTNKGEAQRIKDSEDFSTVAIADIEAVEVSELKKKGGGGKTNHRGKADVDPNVSETISAPDVEDAIVLPEPDVSEQWSEQVPEGIVQSSPAAPLTTTRELPMFAIRYIVKSDRAPNAGDYNELAIVTTEFLDEKFAIVFAATPAKHAFTTIESYKIREPLVVEFHTSSYFYIPGEVPMVSYMYEKLDQQFDAQSQAQDKYMNDLSGMSDTNPFSKAERIEIIDNRPASEGPNLMSGNSDEQKKRTLILVPVVVTVTFFVMGLALCLLFCRRKDNAKAGEDDDNYYGKGMETTDNSSYEEGTIEEYTHTVEAPAMLNPNGTQYYGDDPETVRYLNSIRESGLEEASKAFCSEALEEVSLDDVSVEDDSSEESEVLDGEDNSEEHMADTSSVTANENHTSMASDDTDQSSSLENRAILSRDGEEEALEAKRGHTVEGNATLLPNSEIAEKATSAQNLPDDDATGEAEQNKNDACSVVCKNIEWQDDEFHDVLLEEEKNSLTDEESASPGNGEVDAEPASTSNAAETTAAFPPNTRSTEPVSKNDQDEFNYLHLDSSFEEDLRSIQ